jgi:hypothetical protein
LVYKMSKIYLTFDVEDYINDPKFTSLSLILDLLEQNNLKATFFITGDAAEQLQSLKDVTKRLADHEIGYHSSSHSVRPIIPEYTDISSYEEAIEISVARETSHINPLNGQIEGNGGISSLKNLFRSKTISAFRAPGLCWSPPHMDALKKLGIEYDFSAFFLKKTTINGITFYPYPLMMLPPNGINPLTLWAQGHIFRKIAHQQTTVLALHPHSLFETIGWDCIYFNGNPSVLKRVKYKSSNEIAKSILILNRFLLELKLLQKTGIIDVSTSLAPSNEKIALADSQISQCYLKAIEWPIQKFKYKPRFLSSYFYKFFLKSIN